MKEETPSDAVAANIATEKHFSVKELKSIWACSEQTVIRMFEHEKGVLKFGTTEGLRKRKKITLRIPKSVVERVHAEKSKAA
jgi:predicted DNA binding CopG/RHH family protein